MKERSVLVGIGILIYIITSVIDKLIYKIPTKIYVPVAIISMVITIIGLIKEQKNKKRKKV